MSGSTWKDEKWAEIAGIFPFPALELIQTNSGARSDSTGKMDSPPSGQKKGQIGSKRTQSDYRWIVRYISGWVDCPSTVAVIA
jgi:hypothetical protein